MRSYKSYLQVGTGLWALDRGYGMTELNLLDALVARLTELFKGYELTAKSGLLQNVKVFAQYLPQPQAVTVNTESDEELDEGTDTDTAIEPQGYSPADIESNFPCVIVKLDEATDREEGSLDATRVSVRFLIGTYDEAPDCQGYRDVLNIIEKVRQDLLTMPDRTLDKRYRLEMPMKSYLFDEQAWPIYFGQIETVWETGRPVLLPEFGGRLLPYGRR